MAWTPRAVVVGSGLAGLTCAHDLAAAGWRVVVVTPGRAGRDSATHRVHVLAPWILLTAPWVKGDSPQRLLEDLQERGCGKVRDEVAAALARDAHDAALDICATLDLEPVSPEPVLLPGDEVPRGLRCLPRRGAPLLAPLLARCVDRGVSMLERSLVTGLLLSGERVGGVQLLDRRSGGLVTLAADAVVLACGGASAVFPVTTAPRWCRGSGLALASAAGALLHNPNTIQVLPVTATPPGFFPTSAALLAGAVTANGRPMGAFPGLAEMTHAIAEVLRAGGEVLLHGGDKGGDLLPRRLQASPAFRREGQVRLVLAAHHTVGGVAIDAHGRTSVAGLYACGEAAGGAQGRRRTMGTGLIEARIFGRRAASAVVHDGPRFGPAPAVDGVAPVDCRERAGELEAHLDELLGPLTAIRPASEVAGTLAEIRSWPTNPLGVPEESSALAGIRSAAAAAILAAELADTPATQ